jgi:hypothetical protein
MDVRPPDAAAHAVFRIVEDPEIDLRAVRERVGEAPEALVAYVETQTLARHELKTAAYLRMRTARENGALALSSLLLEARLLEDLLWDVRPDDVLESTEAWRDIEAAHDALSAKEQGGR